MSDFLYAVSLLGLWSNMSSCDSELDIEPNGENVIYIVEIPIDFSNQSDGDIDPLLLDGNDAGDNNDDVNDGGFDGVDDNGNEINDDNISINSEQSDDDTSISSDDSLATTMPWEDYVQEYLEQLVEDIEE